MPKFPETITLKIKNPALNSRLIVLILTLCLNLYSGMSWGQDIINLDIIATIESSNNPMAYNPKSQARGLYQITPICLKDYNSQNNAKIAPPCLFDPKIGEWVAKWYLTERLPRLCENKGIPVTLANILWAYNAGILNVIKGIMPKETKRYIEKYYELSK